MTWLQAMLEIEEKIMWIELLFFVVFFVQIILISYYYPKKIKQRMDYVFEHCPVESYGKMYPKGFESALKGKFTFSLVSNVILVLGLIVFVAASIFIFKGGAKLENFNFLPLAYGMLQGVPFFILELSGFKQFKQMREANHASKRTAELNPRSLFTFITPLKLASAVSACALCIYLILMFNDFIFNATVITLFVSLTLCNSLFLGLGYKIIHGKKLDPHQSAKDRHIATEVALGSFISVSIMVSIFFIFNQSVREYSLDIWEPMFNSIYWVLVMLLSTGQVLLRVKLHDIDFDVYKTPTPSEPATTNK
ncbi:hypothetical protein L0668_16700 [Paraglaciecola aquimarina]|uniref:Uncharacterized protein n=1 Tax=Paraglaciecola algarum TaxID=3050085 RepID=A0ABS9D9X4_9ALTE|nr:hypothetical protein [Paraglaciecola sp. G1-23]MCF2949760.1 hypothetical protein [Paraglaciecola sp. G1-23]